MLGYSGIFGYNNSGFSSSLYSSISQMSSVRSGAYSKALKAYYAKNSTASVTKTQKNSGKNSSRAINSLNNPLNTDLGSVQKESKELVSSAGNLLNRGKNSMFYDEKHYDPHAAYKAVNEFVTNYNETVDAAGKAGNANIKTVSDSMVRMTGNMRGSLAKVGVTVGQDRKLSINETDFKNADLKNVRATFGSNSSYAKMIMSSASRIESASEQQSMINTGIYGRQGLYNNLYAGFSFNGWF